MSEEILFSGPDIFPVLDDQKVKLRERVQSIPTNKFLNASEHDLVQSLVEEFELEVPVLKDEDRYLAQAGREVRVDVSGDLGYGANWIRQGPIYREGNENVVAVPFEGDAEFFRIRPNRYGLNPPRAEIGKGELQLRYVRMDHDAAAIKRESQQTIKEIKDHLSWLQEAVAPYNRQLEELVRSEVRQRKDRLLKDANMAAAIGLPIEKREGIPMTYAVPVKRRVPTIEEIKVGGMFKPEPALSSSDYEEILRIMRNMAQVMERSPHEFAGMGEETLRSHFLVQLNGAYKGQATGETFNFEGKTDILIRVEGKNVFIAECKFWTGVKAFLETIDQLLSYLSWRDTKAAVVVFNRNAGFSAVLAKIADAVPKHPNFKRDLGKQDESTFRYVFGQPADGNREITLTVLAFDVPKPENLSHE
jgi:hypothetical protein